MKNEDKDKHFITLELPKKIVESYEKQIRIKCDKEWRSKIEKIGISHKNADNLYQKYKNEILGTDDEFWKIIELIKKELLKTDSENKEVE